MRRIFQLAHSTLAWAGPKDYSLAFDTIKTIGKIIDQNATNKGIVSTTPFDIEWLRGYPELCLDRGSNLPNNHLIDPWSAVADFLQHQYWKRAWVFQEVVLADQLAFISPGKSNLEWSTRGIQHGISSITRSDTKRPDFLSDTAWDLLSSRLS